MEGLDSRAAILLDFPSKATGAFVKTRGWLNKRPGKGTISHAVGAGARECILVNAVERADMDLYRCCIRVLPR